MENTLLGDGCQLRGSRITNAVLGTNCFVDHGCDIQDTIILGNRCAGTGYRAYDPELLVQGSGTNSELRNDRV